VKVKPVLDVQGSQLLAHRFMPTHPMAGREIGGAESARADLFIDRPWIVDSTGVDGETQERVRELIGLCGATLFELPVAEHDRAVALISHLPQITSSLLASQLNSADTHWLELAGGGLRDTTRIAASDPTLWREIISANASSLTPLLIAMRDQLTTLIGNIENAGAVENFLILGNKGRARIPGKHGGAARSYKQLPVIIEDKPGQLAALFTECDNAGVNVEDISIEHSPGQQTGLVLLSLSPSDAVTLENHLNAHGWNVHSPRSDRA
jgi:prephenate dehydrogenase